MLQRTHRRAIAQVGVQRGLDVGVLDRVTDGPKPQLVADLGARYHTDLHEVDADADIVVECTGAARLVVDVMEHNAAFGIVCLTGVSPRGRDVTVDAGGLNRDIVLENDVVFGSVNANRGHYEAAAALLEAANPAWLARLITRRVPLSRWPEAFQRMPDDVKVVIDFLA